MSINNIDFVKNKPLDIRGNLISVDDRILIGLKSETIDGNRSIIDYARVISVDYTNKHIIFTTPSGNEKTFRIAFKTASEKTFMLSKNYFNDHTNSLKCYSGSIRKNDDIEVNDRVIYVNNNMSLTFGRVLSVNDDCAEIIGESKKRSKTVPKSDLSIKVYIHTKNFFKNHKGNKCYDSHLRKDV